MKTGLTVRFGKRGMPCDLSELVRSGMTGSRVSNRKGRLYASDSTFCARQGALSSSLEFDVPEPAEALAYKELGNKIEDLIIDSLHKKNAILFTQYVIPDVGLNIGGKVDGIIVVDNKIRVLEIKSCGQLPGEPKLQHRAQALFYSAVTGLPASILYMSRNVAGFAGNILLREFKLDDLVEERAATVYRVALAHEANKAGLIPPRPYEITSEEQCGFCNFKSLCWHNQRQEGVTLATPQQAFELSELANAHVERLMNPAALANRRVGVLNFIKLKGNPVAKSLLSSSDWSTLI